MSAASYLVGLTGGIGSGKTTVADRFAVLGAAVVDTDAIAHELTAAGGAAMPEIAAAFGAGANSVNGPNLGSQDPQKGQAEARDAAIANARAEAEAYAKGLGMRVARVLRVSERGNYARQDLYVTASRVASPVCRLKAAMRITPTLPFASQRTGRMRMVSRTSV